jgi:PEP-CTERM motif-containing protein
MIIRAVCRIAIIVVFAGFSLHATTLVLGNPPMLGSGNCDPFGCPGFIGLGTYQQVYLSSAFPTSISIAGLTFYEGQVFNGGVPSGGTYTISFSYTSFDPGGLSTVSPGDNETSGTQTFFTGTLPALTPETGGFYLNITGTPFVYNPADGNLLLTVSVTGATSTGPVLYLNEAACGPKTSCPTGATVVSGDVYFGTTNGGNVQGGLVTGFDYTSLLSTPEPASLLLVLTGVALIGARLRRR